MVGGLLLQNKKGGFKQNTFHASAAFLEQDAGMRK
jgi:hypothetical protein